MDITVVIAAKDRAHNLEYAIASLAGQTLVPFCIVVDFGSQIPINLSKYKFVRVIRVVNNTQPFHKARAVNIGIRNVKTKYLCVTDADQVFAPNFIAILQEQFKINPNFFITCQTYGILIWPKNCNITPENIKENYYKLLAIAKKQRRVYGDGCCHAGPTSWFIDVHGYEESFIGWGFEDSDLCFRAIISNKLKIRRKIRNFTSMIHLPHSKNSNYYKNADNNKRNYNIRQLNKTKIANIGRDWGKL